MSFETFLLYQVIQNYKKYSGNKSLLFYRNNRTSRFASPNVLAEDFDRLSREFVGKFDSEHEFFKKLF